MSTAEAAADPVWMRTYLVLKSSAASLALSMLRWTAPFIRVASWICNNNVSGGMSFFFFPPLILLAIKLTLSSYQHSMYWRVLKNSLRLNFGAFERLYFLYFIYLFIFTLIRYFCFSLFFFFGDVTLALRSAMVAK